MAITHKFVNPHVNGPDPTQTQPSNWNDVHNVDNATIIPAWLASITDGITTDQNGTGSTIEVKTGGIGTPQIAAHAITPGLLGTIADLLTLDQNGSGGTLEIAPGGVNTNQIANGAVTLAKLAPGVIGGGTAGAGSFDYFIALINGTYYALPNPAFTNLTQFSSASDVSAVITSACAAANKIVVADQVMSALTVATGASNTWIDGFGGGVSVLKQTSTPNFGIFTAPMKHSLSPVQTVHLSNIALLGTGNGTSVTTGNGTSMGYYVYISGINNGPILENVVVDSNPSGSAGNSSTWALALGDIYHGKLDNVVFASSAGGNPPYNLVYAGADIPGTSGYHGGNNGHVYIHHWGAVQQSIFTGYQQSHMSIYPSNWAGNGANSQGLNLFSCNDTSIFNMDIETIAQLLHLQSTSNGGTSEACIFENGYASTGPNASNYSAWIQIDSGNVGVFFNGLGRITVSNGMTLLSGTWTPPATGAYCSCTGTQSGRVATWTGFGSF